MSEPESKTIHIESREQLLEIYGHPDMPMPNIPLRVLQDWMYGPERLLDVIRVKTKDYRMTEEMFNAWDELNMSIQNVLVSQPEQLSAAAVQLAESRLKFDKLIRRSIVSQPTEMK
jgi:hypothetical protein